MYNLLLVDDEPLIKVAFQSAVEWGKNGFLLAATASNGQEALHIVETQHIDAVITDLKMPGMDGLALIHELKKRSFTGPILVLSNYSDFDSVRTALTDGAYDYFLKINMNGESIGEHLEKMADLLRVQQQRQTEEDHRSFAIEAQKKENALIHCAQWVTSTAEPSPAANPFSMLPEPLAFPVRLFTVTLIPAKTHPMPALDAVTDLITEVFDEISGKVFLHTHEDEICGLISNESLVASGRTLDKKLARLQRQVTTYFLDAPVIIYHDKPISLAELRQGYQLCEDSKALAFYVGRSAPLRATAHTVTAQPFHVSQAELSKATAAAAQNADELQMQIAVHTFFQNCAALCMPPQRVREACHLLLERPGENMIPQETLEQTFKEIEKAPTADHLTGAFHAHLVDVLEQTDAGLFGEQAAQIFPVQPYIVGNAVQRQLVHIMRVYIDDDGLHLFFEFAQGNFAKSHALLQNQAEQLFKSLRSGGFFYFLKGLLQCLLRNHILAGTLQ